MLDTVKINHVQHISFTQSRLTDAVSVILSELLSYEHPPKARGYILGDFFKHGGETARAGRLRQLPPHEHAHGAGHHQPARPAGGVAQGV